jgi:hypothetical protein
MPTRSNAGAPIEALNAGSALPPTFLVTLNHWETARIVLLCVLSTRNMPAAMMISEHAARRNVAASSSSDALSSSQNDGKVKNKVTPAENANGNMRRPNRTSTKLAVGSTPIRLMPRHARATSSDSGQ